MARASGILAGSRGGRATASRTAGTGLAPPGRIPRRATLAQDERDQPDSKGSPASPVARPAAPPVVGPTRPIGSKPWLPREGGTGASSIPANADRETNRRSSSSGWAVFCSASKAATSEPTNALSLPDNLGSGAAAQHGPSGLRAVAGAASATSAAAGGPPRKRTSRRRRGRPRPGRGMSSFALAGPAMPDGTRAIEGHPRPHARACVWRPSARPGDVPRSGW
jgi:hypothetical protein